MWYRVSIAASAVLVIGTIAANAAELPTYEAMGFAMTPHQMAALGAANAQQQTPAVTPELAGLPASPVQVAVLTRRGARVTTGMVRLSTDVATAQPR